METLYDNRHDWIDQALSSYRSNLPEYVSRFLFRADYEQGPPVVLGPVQQGKTSLLMLLLGIKHDQVVEVAHILRGNSFIGNSATPIPCLYQISIDDYWHCEFLGEEITSKHGTEVSDFLAERRRELQHNVSSISTTMFRAKIAIPKFYFNLDVEYRLEEVLDLPGLEDLDPGIFRYTQEAYDLIIQQASFVLVVNKANQPGIVFETTRGFESLNRWWHSSNKLRVILTTAFSLASARISFDSPSGLVSTLKSNYCRELMEIGMEDQAIDDAATDFFLNRISRMLVLVEVGNTYEMLLNKNEPLSVVLPDIVGSAVKEIVEACIYAQSVYEVVKSLRNGVSLADEFHRENRLKNLKQLSEIEVQIMQADHSLMIVEKRISELEIFLQETSDKEATLHNLFSTLQVPASLDSFSKFNLSEMRNYILKQHDEWKNYIYSCETLISEENNFDIHIADKDSLSGTFQTAAKICSDARDTAIDMIGSRKNKESLDQVRSYVETYLLDRFSAVFSMVNQTFESEIQKIRDREISLVRDVVLLKGIHQERKDLLSKISKERNLIKGIMRKQSNQITKFKKSGKEIDVFLRQSFRRSLKETIRTIENPEESIDRLGAQLKLLSLVQEAQKL